MLIVAWEIANAESGKVQCPGRYTPLMLNDSATCLERVVFINISCFVKKKKGRKCVKKKHSMRIASWYLNQYSQSDHKRDMYSLVLFKASVVNISSRVYITSFSSCDIC